MALTYRGPYQIGPRDDQTDVRPQDFAGKALTLLLDEYVVCDVYPRWRNLPKQKKYQALVAATRFKQPRKTVINPGYAEEFDDTSCHHAGFAGGLNRSKKGCRTFPRVLSPCDQRSLKRGFGRLGFARTRQMPLKRALDGKQRYSARTKSRS
jgi:hypothetical protein